MRRRFRENLRGLVEGDAEINDSIESHLLRLHGELGWDAFRRQLVIGPYITDFACTKLRLIVEVDGPYHEARTRPDARRDRGLAQLGWDVLRIPDHLVFEDLDAVVNTTVARANARAR